MMKGSKRFDSSRERPRMKPSARPTPAPMPYPMAISSSVTTMSWWKSGSSASSTSFEPTISGRLKKATLRSDTAICQNTRNAATRASWASSNPARRQGGLPMPILDKVLAVITGPTGSAASAGASRIERSGLVLDLEHANREPRTVHAAAVRQTEGEDMLPASDHRVVAHEVSIHKRRVEMRARALNAAEARPGAKDQNAFPVDP